MLILLIILILFFGGINLGSLIIIAVLLYAGGALPKDQDAAKEGGTWNFAAL